MNRAIPSPIVLLYLVQAARVCGAYGLREAACVSRHKEILGKAPGFHLRSAPLALDWLLTPHNYTCRLDLKWTSFLASCPSVLKSDKYQDSLLILSSNGFFTITKA